jgi:ribosomal protein L32
MTGRNKGWRERPNVSGKAPRHQAAAFKGKTRKVLRKPITESPEAIAERHIRNAPNDDWRRKYKIRSVRNISIQTDNKVYNGRYILIEYTEPFIEQEFSDYAYSFVGAYIINIPEVYMDEAHPILFYEYDKDTWEKREEKLYYSAKLKARIHIEHNRCSRCGSYKPPRVTKRRGGVELIWITSTCKDCGHKEVQPFD